MEGVVGAFPIAHVVEDEELGLRREIGGVGEAQALQVGFRLLGDIADVAGIELPGDRIADVADQYQGRHRREGIEEGRRGIGDDHHVTFMNFLETADGRSVEADALGKGFIVQAPRRQREVLPDPGQIREAHVHHADIVVLDRLEDVFGIFAVQWTWLFLHWMYQNH